MSTFETLLKVAQGRLDEVSREAGVAAEALSRLNEKLVALGRLHASAAASSSDVTIMIAAGNYMGRQRAERSELERQIVEQRAVLDELRAKLTIAFREKSKFEQLIAQEQARKARLAAELEQKQLDEAALRGVNRR